MSLIWSILKLHPNFLFIFYVCIRTIVRTYLTMQFFFDFSYYAKSIIEFISTLAFSFPIVVIGQYRHWSNSCATKERLSRSFSPRWLCSKRCAAFHELSSEKCHFEMRLFRHGLLMPLGKALWKYIHINETNELWSINYTIEP